jgi:four helix bundle protein
MPIRSYRDLVVWRKAMSLARDIELLASGLHQNHRYGLAAQLRTASSSIPFNIAEGQARPTRVYINHLSIALGSEAELQTQLELVQSMKLATPADIDLLLQRSSEIGRMLRGLIRSLRAHLNARER